MAISLSDLRKVKQTLPARLLVYGEPGVGKSSLAASFPDAVFLQIEDGTPSDLELNSFGKLNTFDEVMEAIAALYRENHPYTTLVVDSISELQRLVFAETCARGDEKGNRKDSIEAFGYGKGYVLAQKVWRDFIDGFNDLRTQKGMTIVLIAHSTVDRFDDPETVSYNRYEIDLHARSVGAIEREMDAILLVKRAIQVKEHEEGFNQKRAVADGGSNIFIHTEGRAAYVAKNRFNMPSKLKFDKGKGYDVIAPYLPGYAQQEAKPATKTEAKKEAA
jgi:hypothetical protein